LTYQSIQEDVEGTNGIDVDRVTALVETGLLRPDDRVSSLEVQSALNNLLSFSYSQVGRLSTIDGDELRDYIRGNLRGCVVLKERLQVRKVKVVGPLSDTKDVGAVVVLANGNVVDRAQAVNSDQLRAVLDAVEAVDARSRSLDGSNRLSNWLETVELNRRHDEVDVAANVLRQTVLVASNAVSAGGLVLVVVVLSVQQPFDLCNSG
jgi:hypothetical protein